MLKISDSLEEQIIDIRKHLHQYPELSFQEYQTSSYIQSVLDSWGITYEKIGDTGVYVDIQGALPGRKIALRADIDALPIDEETDVEYKSKHPNIMHACGHDAHTAVLLGAVKLLHDHRENLHGFVRCIFQPGEEADGAALRLIHLGVLENPAIEAIIGLHVWPHLPKGSVGFREGYMTASCDDFVIDIVGKGGHSARPHQAIDAIQIASSFIQQLPTMKAKKINQLEPSVIHVGSIHGGVASNVVAEKATLTGTTRALNKEVRDQLYREIRKLCETLEMQWEAKIQLNYNFGAPPIYNDERLSRSFQTYVEGTLGAENIHRLSEPSLGADDFGYYAEKIPAFYFRLGIAEDTKEYYDLHHPKFHLDNDVLRNGVELFTNFAKQLTSEGNND